MSTYKKLFEKSNAILANSAKKSQEWFINQINLLKTQRASPYYVMRGSVRQNKAAVIIGNMYFFGYDAKHKEKLPYWDQFPLVIPFSIHPDGFTGINFHYLPYGTRAYLLDELLNISGQNVDENTKLKLSWRTISNISKLDFVKTTVHRYLSTHVVTHYKMVDPPDWKAALLLPVSKFTSFDQKRSIQNTWS